MLCILVDDVLCVVAEALAAPSAVMVCSAACWVGTHRPLAVSAGRIVGVIVSVLAV